MGCSRERRAPPPDGTAREIPFSPCGRRWTAEGRPDEGSSHHSGRIPPLSAPSGHLLPRGEKGDTATAADSRTVMTPFAELAVTTNFSFLRGASHPEELVAEAVRLGLAGIGIADRNSVAGGVRAHVALKETEADKAGLRLAVGSRLVFAD